MPSTPLYPLGATFARRRSCHLVFVSPKSTQFGRVEELGGTCIICGVARLIMCLAEMPFFSHSGPMIRCLGVRGIVSVAQVGYLLRFVYYSVSYRVFSQGFFLWKSRNGPGTPSSFSCSYAVDIFRTLQHLETLNHEAWELPYPVAKTMICGDESHPSLSMHANRWVITHGPTGAQGYFGLRI